MKPSHDLFQKKWAVFMLMAILMPLMCAMIAQAIFAHSSRDGQLLVILLLFGSGVVIIGLLLELYSLLVVLNEQGISVPTWKGRRFMNWDEFTAFHITPPVLILDSLQGRIIVSLTFYQHPSSVIDYIQTRVSKKT